jgi:hypothetical protein
MSGKGSRARPFSVSQEQFSSSWDTIFNQNKKSEAEKFDEKVVMKDEYFEFEEKSVDNTNENK